MPSSPTFTLQSSPKPSLIKWLPSSGLKNFFLPFFFNLHALHAASAFHRLTHENSLSLQSSLKFNHLLFLMNFAAQFSFIVGCDFFSCFVSLFFFSWSEKLLKQHQRLIFVLVSGREIMFMVITSSIFNCVPMLLSEIAAVSRCSTALARFFLGRRVIDEANKVIGYK